MKLAMIGLGRMGANLTRRLMRGDHDCVVYDLDRDAVAQLEHEGAIGAATLDDLVGKLPSPRVIWIMVPAAFTDSVIDELADVLGEGDIVIDGGNGYYRDDVARTERLSLRGIKYVDVGTSGGVFGLHRGFCLMIGGDRATVEFLGPVFATLAPGFKAAQRTPGRTDEPSYAEQGFLHCGPAGAGHFVKMVHNGIEYGIMAAYAEGLAVLRNAGIGKSQETTMRSPRHFEIRSSTATSWIRPTLPRYGVEAA